MEFEFLKFLVDHWLGNIYFEIVRLPRYLAGQKEYEVELQFRLGQMFFLFHNRRNILDQNQIGSFEYFALERITR